MYTSILSTKVNKTSFNVNSTHLKQEFLVDVYKPEGILGNEQINLLLLNDGQDVAKMNFAAILEQAHYNRRNQKLVVVAIHATNERLLQYGVAGVPDFKGRGAKADLYTDFVINELMPYLHQIVGSSFQGKTVYGGFSLGGLSAFDIAWSHPEVFNAIGSFSGAFWWRKKDLADGYSDTDRILHDKIEHTSSSDQMKFWLMTGTDDEKSDRNNNFIIDSIDDTIDVIKALVNKGYKRPENISYFEKVGGKHEVSTWESAMPAFLEWILDS